MRYKKRIKIVGESKEKENAEKISILMIMVFIQGDKYLVDTQGSDYMRYVVKLKM